MSGISMSAERRADLSGLREKDVERQCDSLMAQLGWTAIRFSQPRNTMQTAGIPDRRYYHDGRRLAFWFECKRPGGKQRTAQRAFQLIAEACGEVYVLGGLEGMTLELGFGGRTDAEQPENTREQDL